jgi:hypothetical protein
LIGNAQEEEKVPFDERIDNDEAELFAHML